MLPLHIPFHYLSFPIFTYTFSKHKLLWCFQMHHNMTTQTHIFMYNHCVYTVYVHYQYFRECYMKILLQTAEDESVEEWERLIVSELKIFDMWAEHIQCFYIYNTYFWSLCLGDKKPKHILLDMLMSAFWHLCYYNGSNKTHFWILAGVIVILWVYSVLISCVKTLLHKLFCCVCIHTHIKYIQSEHYFVLKCSDAFHDTSK